MRRILLGLVVLAFGGAALSGCLGGRIDPAASADDALPPGHGEHHDEPAAPSVDLGPPDVVLEAHAGTAEKDLQIHPDPLRVPLGSVVEIRIRNEGATPHTFTIHEFDADTGMMDPGEERTVTFRADEAGSFVIMCDAPGHYQAGMSATLEVAA